MAHNGQTTSLGRIIWKVLKNPLADKLTYEEAAEYTNEFIRLVGAPLALIDEVRTIDINSYKGLLPSNLIEIKAVRYSNDKCFDNTDCYNRSIVLRYATDQFHLHNNTNNYNEYNESTYIVQKGIIQTSIEEGYLQISYKSIAVDEEGFPLIPDNEKFKFGLEYFILHRYLEPIWMMGNITDKVFSYIEQKRHWYLAAANNSLQMPSPDQMESMMNGLNRIIVNTTAHEQAFRNYGVKERIRKYN